MIRIMCLTVVSVFLAGSVFAQGPGPAAGPMTLSRSLQASYAAIKNNLTLAADKLENNDYAFKPSAMPEARSFGQLIGHVANAQFFACSAARGVPNPNMGINNEEKRTKAEVVKALAESFAFCDPAFAALTEENGSQLMTMGGRGQMARSAVLAGLIAHSNEMYGTAAAYLRARNVVPPSTEGAQRQQPARGAGPGRGGQ